MRKLLLIAILVFASTTIAQATDITITQTTLSNARGYSGTVVLRVYYTGCSGSHFIDSLGQVVMCGTVGASTGFYASIPVAVAGSSLTIPAFTLPSTDDSLTPSVTATAVFFVNNARRETLWANWIITRTLGTPITFAQLFVYNQGAVIPNVPDTYLSAADVSALILSVAQGIFDEVPAGSINGVNTTFTLSHVPISGSEAVFLNGVKQVRGALGVGTESYTISGATLTHNLPPLTGDRLTVSYRTTAGLINSGDIPTSIQAGGGVPVVLSFGAIENGQCLQRDGTTIIGANCDTYVVQCSGVDDTVALTTAINSGKIVRIAAESTCATSNITFPATTSLEIENSGLLKPLTGQTVTINGPFKAAVTQAFTNALAGQGTVSIVTRSLQEVYPEWWGASPSASAATNTPALQAAIIGAFGSSRTNGSGLFIYNRIFRLSGMYDINDKLDVFHMIGFRWEGQNKLNSGLNQTATNKQIINGQSVSYGVFNQIRFTTQSSQNTALVDLDYDGSQGEDLRPQNITFNDCFFPGNGAGYIGVRIAKSGGGAQGDNIRFLNNYWSGFTEAALMIGSGADGIPANGAFNAIHIQVIGGDIQSCPKYGIEVFTGSVLVDGTTFENGNVTSAGGVTQTGFDVYAYSSQNANVLRNIRSESVRFAAGGGFVIENCYVEGAGGTHVAAWTALPGTGSFVNQLVTGTPYGGDGRMYLVNSVGTFGGLQDQTATSGSATTIAKTAAGWTINAFVGQRVTIMSGAGQFQYGVITANTADTLTVGAGWVTDHTVVSNSNRPVQITNPAAGSHFIVEPNWIGGVVVSGTVTMTALEFNVIDGIVAGAGGTAFGGKISKFDTGRGGRFRITANVDIADIYVSRQDWINTAPGQAIMETAYPFARIRNVRVIRPGGTEQLPWSIPRNGGTPAFTDLSHYQLGKDWNIWSQGDFGGGTGHSEVGIGRGDGEPWNGSNPTSRNVLGFLGTLGRRTASGTDAAGTHTDIQGGLSTGSGAPGKIRFWTPATAGSTGQAVVPAVSTVEIDLGRLRPYSVVHANLGTMAAPAIVYCSDCNIASPCTAGGAGAYAFRSAAGTWVCPF